MTEKVRPLLPLDERDEALWMLQLLYPGEGIANIAIAVHLPGRIEPEILREAARSVLQRHAMLRSLIRIQDGRACRLLRGPQEVSVRVDRLTSTGTSLDADLRAVARRPFDLERDELTRFIVFELPDATQVLLAVIHHLAIDALSVPRFVNDLDDAYQSLAVRGVPPSALPAEAPVRPLPEPTQESLRYWSERMASLRPGSMLLDAGDYASAPLSFAGGRWERMMSESAQGAVRTLRRHLQATDNVVLLAAYLALLRRHGAGPDLIVGLPLSLRSGDLADTVGNYFSTVPLAVRATSLTTFAQLADDTLTAFLEALEHRDLSHEGMVRRFGRADQDLQTPLLRHMFNFFPAAARVPARHTWAAGATRFDTGYSRYDLELVIGSSAKNYYLEFAYRSAPHDESFVRRLADRYEALLLAAADDPERAIGRLPMITAHEEIVRRTNQTTVRWRGPRTTPGLVNAQIARRPEHIAIASPAGRTSYQRLGELTRRIHAILTAGGVGPGDIVAVAAGRGPATVAAILAAWRAGAAYLPLDPAQPAERLRYQLHDARTTALVADRETIERLADPAMACVPVQEILSEDPIDEEADRAEAGAFLPRDPDEESIAYVIYTSGSTGKPKAVRITHGNLANVVRHFGEMLKFQADQKMLWLTTLAFDISALEFLVPLSRGGTIVVAEPSAGPERLIETISESGVDVVQATPTTWRMIVGRNGLDLTGRWLLCGGEPLSGTLARDLLATGGRLVNVYGPSETTIWSTAEPIQQAPEKNPAAGRPIANTTIAVVDEFGADCPIDVVGEVVIGGAGVAAGYLGRADLTAQRFISRGESGRAYRTGDLGRWRPDGRLALHGRIDRQVKVHGGRVELDEVESVLKSHPAVEGAAVLLRQPGQLTEALAAFVVPSGPLAQEELWNHAAKYLPSYALPSTMTFVPAIPINLSGKVDYVRLATFVQNGQPTEAPPSMLATTHDPSDEITAWLVRQWRELLDDPNIHADSNLFLVGGQSLLAITITDQASKRFDIDLPPLAIFQNPTPRGLAAEVKACQTTQRDHAMPSSLS